MNDWLHRLHILLGEASIKKLKDATVAVVGLGGVGSFTAEALARSGVGHLILVDGDVVETTNRNRQLPALDSTLGCSKALVVKDRVLDINPELDVQAYSSQWHLNSDFLFKYELDYIVDAIDSFRDKIDLIIKSKKMGVPLISAMGAGGKLDGSKFEVADLSKTINDPLARRVRQALRKQGIEHLKVIFSPEKPKPPEDGLMGSAVFVTGVAGLLLAGEVIKEIAGKENG